jgi:hypothetical protein
MRYFFVFIFLITALTGASQELHFSLSEEVASTGTYGGLRPRIALLHDSIPLIVFGKGGSDPAVYITRKTTGGFSIPLRINGPNTGAITGTSDGPEIRTSGDTVFVVYAAFQAGTPVNRSTVVMWRSFDGGQNFSDSTVVMESNTDMLEFPNFTLTPEGNPVVAALMMELSGSATSIETYYSTDQGASFSASTGLLGLIAGQPCECCPIALEAAGNRIFLGYRNNISNLREFYVAGSTDFGQNFTQSWQIDHSGWVISSCPVNGIDFIHTGDSLHAAFPAMWGSTIKIRHAAISADGSGQGPDTFAEMNPPNSNMSNVCITGNSDTLFVGWQDTRLGSTDVQLSHRINPATQFSEPIAANDSISGAQRNIDMQWKNSELHLVYTDVSYNKVVYRKASFSEFISVNETESQLLLYPNPVKDHVIIKDSKELIINVLIYNSLGQVQLQVAGNYAQEMNINTEGLRAGVYVLEAILASGKKIRRQIVIQ